MRIPYIRLENFRNHANTEIDLDHINIFYGKNNSGKSSILGGLNYGLTRSAEWLTGRGGGADKLVRNNGRKAVIEVEVDGFGRVTSQIGSGSPTKINGRKVTQAVLAEELEEKFELGSQALKCAMSTGEFINMTEAKQQDFLFALTDFVITLDVILENLKDPVDGAEEMIKAMKPQSQGVELFDEIYKNAYKMRTECKKEIAELAARIKNLPVSTSGVDGRVRLNKEIAELNKKRDALFKMLGEKNNAKKQKVEISKEIDRVKETISRLFSEAKRLVETNQLDEETLQVFGYTIEEMVETVSRLDQERSELAKKSGEYSITLKQKNEYISRLKAIKEEIVELSQTEILDIPVDDAKASIECLKEQLNLTTEEYNNQNVEIRVLKTKIDTTQSIINKLESADNKCPLSDLLVCKTDKSPLINELKMELENDSKILSQKESVVRGIQEEIERGQKELTILENTVKIVPLIKRLENEREELENKINAIAITDEDIVELNNRIKLLQLKLTTINNIAEFNEKLNNLEKRYEKIEVSEEELNDIVEKIAVLDREIKDRKDQILNLEMKEKQFKEFDQLSQAYEKKELELDVLEYLVKEFGPNGMKNRLLREKMGPIEDIANMRLAILTNGMYSMRFDLEDGFQLLINNGHADLPIRYLSESEKIRIGIIMQDALNSLTKARLLIIDNLEILDNENKDLFMDLVEEISQNYDTVLIALTTEEFDMKMLPNMKVFKVEDAVVTEMH